MADSSVCRAPAAGSSCAPLHVAAGASLARARALYWARSALFVARFIRLHGVYEYHGGDAVVLLGYWGCLEAVARFRREAAVSFVQLDLFGVSA